MKKIIYTIISAILMLTLSFSVCACGAAQTPVSSAAPTETSEDNTQTPEASKGKNTVYFSGMSEKYEVFNTKDELSEASSNIIAGKCVSAKSAFKEHGFMYTVCEVEVTQCFKGNLAPGSTVKVVEFGGTCPASEFIKESGIEEKDFYDESAAQTDPDLTVTTGIDGYYPMSEGQDVLLFLGESGTYDGIADVYGVMGSSDGKLYKISDTTYARPLSEATAGYSKAYSLQSCLNNTDLKIDISELK